MCIPITYTTNSFKVSIEEDADLVSHLLEQSFFASIKSRDSYFLESIRTPRRFINGAKLRIRCTKIVKL